MRTPDPLAHAAVSEARPGMVIGLGTGRAAARGIEALAARARQESTEFVCVATSVRSADQARALGLNVTEMERVPRVDLLFDGADEVDPQLRMIKGRGGAMTREKIVARAASRRIYLVQRSKMVPRLGASAPVPIEFLRFGAAWLEQALGKLGLFGSIRREHGVEVRTDDGNPIFDAALPSGMDPAGLAARLDTLPGVVGHGLFIDEADLVLVEEEDGRVTRLARPRG